MWCRIRVVTCCKRVLAAEELSGTGVPDLRAVDRVARLALLAKRHRARVVVTDLHPRLRELLDLVGLDIDSWTRAPSFATCVAKPACSVWAPCPPGFDRPMPGLPLPV